MGNRRPGRAWPFPRRELASAISPEQWDRLLAIAGVALDSEDGRVAHSQLKSVAATMPVTLDGRLVSEARPRPAEIRDPIAAHAIPGAAMLARYFADIDDDSLEAILVEGLDAVSATTGVDPRLDRAARGRALDVFATTLRWLLPALVHARQAADASVAHGRPPVPRRETECVAIELATIWAEHADADPTDFHPFVAGFFELCGARPPARKQYAEAVAAAGDMTSMSVDDLAELRSSHAAERRRLLEDCDRWREIRLMVRSHAEQAWDLAKDLGWDADGEAASWRELARAQRDGNDQE